jgi:hypothetical protein
MDEAIASLLTRSVKSEAIVYNSDRAKTDRSIRLILFLLTTHCAPLITFLDF